MIADEIEFNQVISRQDHWVKCLKCFSFFLRACPKLDVSAGICAKPLIKCRYHPIDSAVCSLEKSLGGRIFCIACASGQIHELRTMTSFLDVFVELYRNG